MKFLKFPVATVAGEESAPAVNTGQLQADGLPATETVFPVPKNSIFLGNVAHGAVQGRKLPTTLQRAFVEILQQNRQQQHDKQHQNQNKYCEVFVFSLKRIVEREGVPAVKFKETEGKKLAEKADCLTLIGNFTQSRPAIDVIRTSFHKLFPVVSLAHVRVIDSRNIMLQFYIKEDCERVLLKGQAVVEGKLVRFSRWSSDWMRRRASPFAPVWIQLLNLLIHLFNSCSLAHVCAPIGKLIGLDSLTVKMTRPSVARAQVEIDLRREKIDKIRLEVWGKSGEIVGFW